MGLKPDHWIKKMAMEEGMIKPFVETQVRQGVISYGVSSYGYDIRVADEFKIFTNVYSAMVDPKNFSPQSMIDFQGETCTIPPNSFALARTMEWFHIPRGVLTICLGKSTYARCGIIVNVTPFEPNGRICHSRISNTTPLPPKYMPTKGLPRSSSLKRTNPAPLPTLRKKGNTRASSPSCCRAFNLPH